MLLELEEIHLWSGIVVVNMILIIIGLKVIFT